MTDAEHIKELEARVAELERRLIGGAAAGAAVAAGTVYSIPDSCYFDNGMPMSGGRGGGGQ